MSDDKMSVSSLKAEYKSIAASNKWTVVYQKLGRQCQTGDLTVVEARKPMNKPLNRYRDVNPYDHSRVILQRCDQDYINANLVKMARANRRYILTQGPLPATVSHFWLMVWEQRSRAILMLNKIIEKNEIKCHWYWPHDIGDDQKMVLTDVKLTVEQISAEDFTYYSTRTFRLVDLESGESRSVMQFHYTTWPDFGVPSSPVVFLKFLQQVRASGALEADAGPAIVHCSAGIGRSGTFCLVDSCLLLIEKDGIDSVDVREVLLELRRDRMGLIQTPDQLKFSYQAIIEGTKRLDPNWKEEENGDDEDIYAAVAEEEDAPPPPPPRVASLPPDSQRPMRPLPTIPTSTSMGDMRFPVTTHSDSDSSSDEAPPPLPPLSAPPPPRTPRARAPTPHDTDEDEPALESGSGEGEPEVGAESASALRQRKNRCLAERVEAVKRRARDAERWHSLKRFKKEGKPQSEPDAKTDGT